MSSCIENWKEHVGNFLLRGSSPIVNLTDFRGSIYEDDYEFNFKEIAKTVMSAIVVLGALFAGLHFAYRACGVPPAVTSKAAALGVAVFVGKDVFIISHIHLTDKDS
jgi:hypothetical protein